MPFQVYTPVCKYRLTKNGFAGPKRFRNFQETNPSSDLEIWSSPLNVTFPVWRIFVAKSKIEIPDALRDEQHFNFEFILHSLFLEMFVDTVS